MKRRVVRRKVMMSSTLLVVHPGGGFPIDVCCYLVIGKPNVENACTLRVACCAFLAIL